MQEIIRYTEPREVSSGKAWMQGVISLRGKIMPVCDLSIRLNLSHDHDPETAKIVILDVEGSTAGVVVDNVEEVRAITPDQIDPAPAATSGLLSEIAKIDDRLIVLLDPEAVVQGVED